MHRIIAILAMALIIAAGCSSKIPQSTTLATMDLPIESRQLSTFTTKFDPANKGRVTNIKLSAKSIDRIVVQPDEEFSFNTNVGPTTKENGYQLAMIYVDGQKEEGYGGGVCQVSSTLHNAAVLAGMEVIERHDHSLPVSYAEAGKEAATSYGVKDYKFINQLRHPVVIDAEVTDQEVTITISVA